MKHLKTLIRNIPIVGYIIRLIAALILLPRTLSKLHNESVRTRKDIEELQQNAFSANLKIIELNEEAVSLGGNPEKPSRKAKL